MKRGTLLAVVAVIALVTLACSPCGLIGDITGREGPEATQPPATPSGEQPTAPPESGGVTPEIAGLDTLDSYRLHITWRGENEDGSELYEMTITEEWVREPQARHMVMSTSQSGAEEMPSYEVITIGDTTWMKMGDTWMQMEASDQSAEGLTDAWEGFLMGDVGDWTLVGEETMNGVHCKHYTSGDETSITVPDLESGGTVTIRVQGESWVADQAGLPSIVVREQSQMEGGFFPMPLAGAPSSKEAGIVYWEYDVSDINAPITIEPPQ